MMLDSLLGSIQQKSPTEMPSADAEPCMEFLESATFSLAQPFLSERILNYQCITNPRNASTLVCCLLALEGDHVWRTPDEANQLSGASIDILIHASGIFVHASSMFYSSWGFKVKPGNSITCTLYRWTSVTVTDTIGYPGPCRRHVLFVPVKS